MYLIELKTPIEVGVTMTGGTLIYNRIRIQPGDSRNSMNTSGEWVTRQYLTHSEAKSYQMMEASEGSHGRDIVIAGIRGLPRVLELDNALIRMVRRHFFDTMGAEVCVQVYTIQHSAHTANSSYHDDYTDEPIMIVSLLKMNGGGKDIRKHWSDNNKGSTSDLRIGSVTLQIFMEIKDIFKKPCTITGRIFDIDSRKIVRGDDMGVIIKELGSNYERVEVLCKAVTHKDRWFALLKRNQEI